MVHHFATKYFGLPSNHTKVIADAVAWTDKAAKAQPGSYDYIVHDVFTGGAEPTSLFTYEFIQNLSLLLKEDGAIALVRCSPSHSSPCLIRPELCGRHNPATTTHHFEHNIRSLPKL